MIKWKPREPYSSHLFVRKRWWQMADCLMLRVNSCWIFNDSPFDSIDLHERDVFLQIVNEHDGARPTQCTFALCTHFSNYEASIKRCCSSLLSSVISRSRPPTQVNSTHNIVQVGAHQPNLTKRSSAIAWSMRKWSSEKRDRWVSCRLILKREIPRRFGHRHNLFSEHRLKDDRSSSSTLPMGEYYSYDEIVQWMRNLERLHRNIVRVVSIGTTHQGRNIFGVVVWRALTLLIVAYFKNSNLNSSSAPCSSNVKTINKMEGTIKRETESLSVA